MKPSNFFGAGAVIVATFFAIDHYYGNSRGGSQRLPGPPRTETLPAFHLPLLGPSKGSEISLQSLRGRTTFIEFWASWCESCRQERPLLNKLRADAPDASMLAVATLDDEASVRKSEADNPHGYPVVLDEKGTLAQSLSIEAIPQSLVIDDQGKVLRHFRGPLKETDLKEIVKLLN